MHIPTLHTTRILSVFSLLKRVGFAVLLLGGGVFAQDVIWVRNGETANSHFGGFVFPLGDQNDDGFDDWAVYSSGNENGPDNEESFDFFYGGNPPSQEPYISFRPRLDHENEYMLNLTPIGDFNGDDFIDWVIGYWTLNDDSIRYRFFNGGPVADTLPDAMLHVPFVFYNLLGTIGDHNGDGFDDLYRYYADGPDLTYIMFGNSEWELSPDLMNQGEPVGSQNSRPRLDMYGDLTGDRYSDYITHKMVGISDSTFVYFGSAEPDTIPDIRWEGNFASPATLSGDLNGDGAKDLAVGGVHTIAVHLGGQAPSHDPTFVLNFECSEGGIRQLMSVGDYNDDGFADLTAVSPSCPNGFRQMELFLGGFWLNPDPVLTITGLSSPPFDEVPIWNAVDVGDVNSDGIDDLGIGCQGDILEGRRGRVVILSGDTTLHVDANEHSPIAQDLSLSVFPNPFNSSTRITLSLPLHVQRAELRIHNLLGQEVLMRELHAENGQAEFALDGTNLATGVYLVSARSGESIATQKVMLLK